MKCLQLVYLLIKHLGIAWEETSYAPLDGAAAGMLGWRAGLPGWVS